MYLLRENSAKAVNTAFKCCAGTTDIELIVELRRLWEMAKVSLPDEVVTHDIASHLGKELSEEGHFKDSKVFALAALKGRRSVLGRSIRRPSLR